MRFMKLSEPFGYWTINHVENHFALTVRKS